MKVIEPSIELFDTKNEDPCKRIERIARVCYKSEDKITDTSYENLLTNLYNNKHYAMFEHYIWAYEITRPVYDVLMKAQIPFMRITETEIKPGQSKLNVRARKRFIISFSARTLLDILENIEYPICVKRVVRGLMGKVVSDFPSTKILFSKKALSMVHPKDEIVKEVKKSEYLSNEDLYNLTRSDFLMHAWATVKFICDRGISHEIVRHRDASFAQESTRYAAYNKDKFGNEITVIRPMFFQEGTEQYTAWYNSCVESEAAYMHLMSLDCKAQEARSVLPNSLKTEVVMTARAYEWKHFFELRCVNAAHPQMRQVATKAQREFLKHPFLWKYFDN